MVLVTFLNDKGEKVERYIDKFLLSNIKEIKHSVLEKDWDYLAICSGEVGSGKSTFAAGLCKALDSSFTTKHRICFTAFGEKGLIERTTNAKKGQAFMLDESFADLNSNVVRSPDFIAIVNHLQLIRQKNLFIILCLPDFFSLSKSMAIFRSRNLFVIYHDRYKRGYYAAFAKSEKRLLYIKGKKFLDLNCVEPNFRARFVKKWIADVGLYEKLKLEHLKSQFKSKSKEITHRDTKIRNNLIRELKDKKFSIKEISDMAGVTRPTIYSALQSNEKNT